MLKKSVLVVAVLLVATNLWAAKTMDVSGTRHNLSSTSVGIDNYYKAGLTSEDEVCIFCHTPHGGALTGPLWNRNLPTATGFTHYSSATLSGYMKGLASNRNVNAESLLCMGCHDGSIAASSMMNSIINTSNRTDAAPDNSMHIVGIPWLGITAGAIGDAPNGTGGLTGETKNLSDDHPISFSYYSAWNHAGNSGKLNRADGVAANDPRTDGIRFFGPDVAGEQRVECSSCHDPHVNYETATGGDVAYTPFLVMPNTGSALCLACHIK